MPPGVSLEQVQYVQKFSNDLLTSHYTTTLLSLFAIIRVEFDFYNIDMPMPESFKLAMNAKWRSLGVCAKDC